MHSFRTCNLEAGCTPLKRLLALPVALPRRKRPPSKQPPVLRFLDGDSRHLSALAMRTNPDQKSRSRKAAPTTRSLGMPMVEIPCSAISKYLMPISFSTHFHCAYNESLSPPAWCPTVHSFYNWRVMNVSWPMQPYLSTNH